jgi:hypothetical protein
MSEQGVVYDNSGKIDSPHWYPRFFEGYGRVAKRASEMPPDPYAYEHCVWEVRSEKRLGGGLDLAA